LRETWGERRYVTVNKVENARGIMDSTVDISSRVAGDKQAFEWIEKVPGKVVLRAKVTSYCLNFKEKPNTAEYTYATPAIPDPLGHETASWATFGSYAPAPTF
jgi:hypothetical protein